MALSLGFSRTTSSLDPALQRPATSFLLSRQIVLRGIGLVYLAAFLSFWVQADGLVGSKGILPVSEYLAGQKQAYPQSHVWRNPTLLWLNSSDAALDGVCVGGAFVAILIILGVLQLPLLAIAWVLYLSITVAGQEFFLFQWDSLLLEAGFLAIFLAPWQVAFRPARQAEPSRVVLWLFWWLLFRLMFLSAITKLAFDDPTWRDGTALQYHYWTQPLPTWTSWYAFRLPEAFQKFSVWLMFFVEGIVSIAVLLGKWGRRLAVVPLIGLQLAIAGTGNYGFFNLLALVLCLSLIDDAAWRAVGRLLLIPWHWIHAAPRPASRSFDIGLPIVQGTMKWPLGLTGFLAASIIPLSIAQGIRETPYVKKWPKPVEAVIAGVTPFRVVNGYGLFRVMTTRRIEIIVEGSQDGQSWRPYEFKWKPGDITCKPGFCTPHMPRLDWQMWFLPFGGVERHRFFTPFAKGLLDGNPKILKLLGTNPFADKPPKWVRARAFDYRFSKPAALDDGYFWHRAYVLDAWGPASLIESDPTTHPAP